MLTVERYARTRFWALYENRHLLCVTVYKKGANAVKERIERGVPLAAPAPDPPPTNDRPTPDQPRQRATRRKIRFPIRYS